MARALLHWVACQPPVPQPHPTTSYMGRSWGWCVGPAWPRLGDSLLLNLAKARMGFWAQVVDWVTSSREDLLGRPQGCRGGDVRGWPGRVLPALAILLPGRYRLPRGLWEDQMTRAPVSEGTSSAPVCPASGKASLTLGMLSGPGLGALLPGVPGQEGHRAGPAGSAAKKPKLRGSRFA